LFLIYILLLWRKTNTKTKLDQKISQFYESNLDNSLVKISVNMGVIKVRFIVILYVAVVVAVVLS